MRGPWNGWYHCITSTYGTWLYGDARGFRTRHHRQDVPYDYKNPPPEGMYDRQLKRTLRQMRYSPVVLNPSQRRVVCLAMGERLEQLGVEVIDICVDSKHIHILCRFPNWFDPAAEIPGLRRGNALQDGRDPVPRHIIGVAKKHASHVLRTRGLKPRPGALWTKRGKIIPVTSRQHQLRIVAYIRRHTASGAVVWTRIADR